MPRKGENIYKRKDGRWEARYIKSRSEEGKAIYGYIYAKTYREVKDKMVDAILKRSTMSFTENTEFISPSLSEIIASWFKTIRPRVKESTVVKYENLLQSYIIPILGEKKLNEITHDCLEDYCNYLLLKGGNIQQGLSPKTVSDTISLLRNVLRFAAERGMEPPCNALSISIKQSQKKMRVLSHSEQQKLCHYLYSNLTARNLGILLCLFTGLRIGEICALKWEDISLEEGVIYVHQTMQRLQIKDGCTQKTQVVISSPKSECSLRKIPLSDELTKLIHEFPSSSKGFLLTGSDIKYLEPRAMQYYFKTILKKASISDANFHSLRHTFATRCVEVGFDVKSLSEILGHASVNITMNRYVHPTMELKRENMQRLSDLFSVR